MTNAKKLFYNTLLLTASAFIMRTVLVSFNIYLSNRIGADGIGLFQLISSVYGMSITFSTAGVKLASMRLVADSLALCTGNQRQIMRPALAYSVICGCVTGAALFRFADLISIKWIGDAAACRSVEILSLSLPFVAASAALNGYFTSESKILRFTSVQLLEQGVKILTAVLFLKSADGSIENSCSAIVTGITMGEAFSFSLSYIIYRFTSRYEKSTEKGRVFRSLLRIALPDALGSEIRSVLSTAEHMLIPRGLKKSGSSPDGAIATYGVIHGMSLPVVLYPSALLSSLSGLLVPEVSSHRAAGSKERIRYIIRRVLHLTLLFSVGTAVLTYFCADIFSEAFYSDLKAGEYIRVLAPLIPVMYCDMSVDGILKGLDQQVQYMKYNVIDAASCVVLVYFLVPKMSVKGYIFVIFFSEILNFALSLHRLSVVADVEINPLKDIATPLTCALSACGALRCSSVIFFTGQNRKLIAAASVIIFTAVYIILLRLFGSVDKEETEWLKKMLFRKNKDPHG